MDTIVKLVSLNELAKKLSMNKSRLSFYTSMGLLVPANTIGKMMVFDEVAAVKRVKEIIKQQKAGLSIAEIKEKIN